MIYCTRPQPSSAKFVDGLIVLCAGEQACKPHEAERIPDGWSLVDVEAMVWCSSSTAGGRRRCRLGRGGARTLPRLSGKVCNLRRRWSNLASCSRAYYRVAGLAHRCVPAGSSAGIAATCKGSVFAAREPGGSLVQAALGEACT